MCSSTTKNTNILLKQTQIYEKVEPFEITKIQTLLTKLQEANISTQDLQNGLQLFTKVAECLHEVKMRLPPIKLGIKSAQDNGDSVEQFVILLQKLRIVSIALLNNKFPKDKVITQKRKRGKIDDAIPEKLQKIEPSEIISSPKSHPNHLKEICYICKKSLKQHQSHNHYLWMCPRCGDFNWTKRNQTVDLSGKVALITGARVKIGFEAALKLLRAGADRVIVTTRFPVDALRRYEKEADFSVWSDKLDIYQLDMRYLQDVTHFCEHITKTYPKLDILLQNAAQTIRKPTAYYRTLIEKESTQNKGLSNHGNKIIKFWNEKQFIQNTPSPAIIDKSVKDHDTVCTLFPENRHPSSGMVHPDDFKYAHNAIETLRDFPKGQVDEDGQQLDLRRENTWTLRLGKVETAEMVEVTLVNYMAPYLLLQKLTPLMKNEKTNNNADWSWIVLVSAMEGKFMDCYKTQKHPHTNAAKAALNMLVRTCAREYKNMGILLTAVDTGWVTEEHPHGYFKHMDNFKPPLDCVDGAARVLDPIFQTVNSGVTLSGRFVKDYAATSW